MSRFSDRLKQLIDGCDKSIYQLAKTSGLDRTTIQRLITGDRLPSLGFVEDLCKHLRVSPTEKKDILELYTIAKIGEKTHSERLCIKNMIENIANIDINAFKNLPNKKTSVSFPSLNQEITFVSGQFSVNSIIRELIEAETFNESSPHVRIIVPFEFTILFDCLKQLYWKSKGQLSIDHILCLNKNHSENSNSNVNLDILSNILPFAFCAGSGYSPSYYYGENIANEISLAMPYYFITSKVLVTISSDFSTAIIYTNNDMIETYSKHFDKCASQTIPFIKSHLNCMDLISSYDSAIHIGKEIHEIIEPQPCFAKYYTADIIEKYLRPDVENRDIVKQYLIDYDIV